jgi:subtilisin family serine protease
VWLAAAAALALLAGPAPAQELQRADPLLRFLLTHRQLLSGDAVAGPARPLGLRPDGPGEAVPPPGWVLGAPLDLSLFTPHVRTLVRLGPGGEAALRRHGARIGTRAGDVVTARVPVDAFPDLLLEPGIRAMEAAASLRLLADPAMLSALAAGRTGEAPAMGFAGGGAGTDASTEPPAVPIRSPAPIALNDSAAADAGFDALRRRGGERWEGLAGQGVIVGVYDSGLDLTHADFRGPGGGTRVLYAWDQTVAGSGPGGLGGHLFDYGAECTAGAIDSGSCPMVDRVGHGTHVAGTAAGNGAATGRGRPAYRFPGGAPAADLIVVKGGDAAFSGDRLVDGVAYIFARAAALGRPAVVNISLSTQEGPHDGTTLVERALNALSGPGRIIVSGAGNAGDHRNTLPPVRNGPFHAHGQAGGLPHAVRVPPYQAQPGEMNDAALLELWYDGADSVTVTVRTPRGELVSAATGDTILALTPAGAVAIVNAFDGPSPLNGDHAAHIAIADFDTAPPPDSGRWEIQVSPIRAPAGGGYHLWLVGSTFDAYLEGGTTNRFLVGVPASADRILAVGAHVTRHDWTGVDGEVEVFPVQERLGDIAYFSSPGPRRDGVQKPDLSAPGKVLVSARSKDATLWDAFPGLVEEDSVHVALLGTSVSSPQVAAAVAILLQVEPRLTPEEARDLLRASAATDAFVLAPVPGPVWGAGKLAAAAAVHRLRPAGLVHGAEPVTLSANPVRGDALVIGYAARPRSVAVYTLAAERVRTFGDGELGPVTAVWPLDTDAGGAVANGAYVLVVELPDQRIVRKLLVARP